MIKKYGSYKQRGGMDANRGVWMQRVGGAVAVKRGVDLDGPYIYISILYTPSQVII